MKRSVPSVSFSFSLSSCGSLRGLARCLVVGLAACWVPAAAQAAWVIPSAGSHHSRSYCIDLFDEDSGAFAGELRCEHPYANAMTLDAEGDVFLGRATGSNTWLSEYDGFDGTSNFLFSNGSIGEIGGLLATPGGDLLAASNDLNRVYRLDPVSGAVIDIPIFGSSLAGATAVAYGPDGHLYVADESHGRLFRFDGATGARLWSTDWAPVVPRGLAFGSDGFLYVSSRTDDAVLKIDPATGASLGPFASGSGLDDPEALVFGPGGDLYVASSGSDQILRFDGTTGAFVSVFASDPDLPSPSGLVFGPDGHLYASNLANAKILRFDGTTGASMGVFAEWVSGIHRALAFGPDGDLFASGDTGTVRQLRRYDGTTGVADGFRSASGADGMAVAGDGTLRLARATSIRQYDISGASGAVDLGDWTGGAEPGGPTVMRYGPDGALYVVDTVSDRVLRYDAATYESSGVFAEGGGVDGIQGMAFGPAGDLYLSSRNTNEVLRYDGTTGAPLGVFASGGGLNLPAGIVFGNDGDLYVDSWQNGVLRFDGATGAFVDTFIFPAGDFDAFKMELTSLQDTLAGETPVIDETGDGVDGLVDPVDAAVGPDGSVYVVGRVSANVFRVEPDGTTTLLLDASGGGTGTPLSNPFRIAVGGDGSVAVASDNEAVHRIKPDGSVDLVMDSSSPFWSGARDVAVGPDGSVYTAGEYDSVWKIAPSGFATRIMTHLGDFQGNQLDGPSALWVDDDGFVYVAAQGSRNAYEISPSGGIIEIFDGLDVTPQLYNPSDIAKDDLGNVYVGGGAGQEWATIYKISPSQGSVRIVYSSVPLAAMTVDSDGDLYYALTRGLYYQVTPSGLITPLDDLVGPLGRVLGGVLDFEATPQGDLVVPSMLANAVYKLDVPSECEDGLDNDGDGYVDYPADPGCRSLDWVEDPVCDDDIDNDGDGKIDYDGGPNGEPADGVCKNAWEVTEARACGAGFEALLLLVPLWALRRGRSARQTA
ncbi:MAG: PQQ-binding-like beta-propeller repeat protein [Myxococcota bacterium]